MMDQMAALGRAMAAKCREADGDDFLFDKVRGSLSALQVQMRSHVVASALLNGCP